MERGIVFPMGALLLDHIKDPEIEAMELQDILRAVGESLRQSSSRLGKSGLSYAQFIARKTQEQGAQEKTTAPSHARH